MHFIIRFLILMPLLTSVAIAADGSCDNGRQLTHTFDSGAAWTACAQLDQRHGLELTDIAYRAPADISRPVLNSLHLGQLLLHYHEDSEAFALVDATGLGGTANRILNSAGCSGELLSIGERQPQLCAVTRATGLLAKYNMHRGTQGEAWHVFSVSQRGAHTWQIGVVLGEDGRITPQVSLSGRIQRTTGNPLYGVQVDNSERYASRATIVANWRLDFALDTDAGHAVVEEYEFMLDPALGNRRPMQVHQHVTEALRKVERKRFRGWRIRDTDGRGYYLDPQDAGYAYISRQTNWAQFDLAITRRNPCERHALLNSSTTPGCGASLDDFINGESLVDQSPVLWYSQTRSWHPRREDLPAIASVDTRFDLLPFDWTAASPFEVPVD